MKTDIKAQLKNKYNIKVIRDGIVREEYNFGNTICKNLFHLVSSGGDNSNKDLSSMAVGSGTGTPSWDDTQLFSELWRVSMTNSSGVVLGNGDYKVTYTATIPATNKYIGTITEVGLYHRTADMYGNGRTYGVITHAMITDAEGNNISINKTDLDIVIISVDFILSVSLNDITAKTLPNVSKNLAAAIYPVITDGERIYGYLVSLDTNSKNKAYSYILYRFNIDMDAKKIDNYVKTARLETNANNGVYFKGFYIADDCYYDLRDIMTPYSLTGASIGTGDGATTIYPSPLSYFKAGTEKIYKNGTLLTRGADYTVENVNNSAAIPYYYNTMLTEITGGTTDENIKNSVSSDVLIKFLAASTIKYGSYVGSGYKIPSGYGIVKGKPYIINFKEPVKCNTLILGEPLHGTPNITLSYSSNGVNYTPVDTINGMAWTTAIEQKFADATAQYWKLEVDSETPIVQRGGQGLSAIIYKTDGIIFTTPPADGEVLTMDAILDYPLKNDKHVTDINWDCSITFE